VAKRLSDLLGKQVPCAPDCIGKEVEGMAAGMKPGDVLLLENLRFHPEEEKNDNEFGQRLGLLADVYVNDAFATAHRGHASNVAVMAAVKESCAGFLLKNELDYFHKAMENPERPLIAVMGGAKVSGKLDALENIVQKVDAVIVGGGMAFTFLRAQGYAVGASLVEEDLIQTATTILEKAKQQGGAIVLPIDCVVAETIDANAATEVVSVGNIPAGWMGLDIGPQTESLFTESLRPAKTIVWNGPMGVFEKEPFSKGTEAVVKALAHSEALTIVGGGDSVTAVHKWHAADQMSYISTGGGAFLEMLEGKKLPAIAALEKGL
jgi:phosphoglycerate kinase